MRDGTRWTVLVSEESVGSWPEDGLNARLEVPKKRARRGWTSHVGVRSRILRCAVKLDHLRQPRGLQAFVPMVALKIELS